MHFRYHACTNSQPDDGVGLKLRVGGRIGESFDESVISSDCSMLVAIDGDTMHSSSLSKRCGNDGRGNEAKDSWLFLLPHRSSVGDICVASFVSLDCIWMKRRTLQFR